MFYENQDSHHEECPVWLDGYVILSGLFENATAHEAR